MSIVLLKSVATLSISVWHKGFPLPANTADTSPIAPLVVPKCLVPFMPGQTGQLLLGAYQALSRQIGLGNVQMFPRTEFPDLVLVDGHAKGVIMRNVTTVELSRHLLMR